MEYMHPFWKGKKPFTGTGKVCWLVMGFDEIDVITTHPRTSRDIVALRTRNIMKLTWFLAAYQFTVAKVEYEECHLPIVPPNYG